MDPTTVIAALSTSEPRIPVEALAAARPLLPKLADPLRQLIKDRLNSWEETQQPPDTLDCLYALALLVENRDPTAGHFCLKLADRALDGEGLPKLSAPIQAALFPGLIAHTNAQTPASLFDWFLNDNAPSHRLVHMQMTLLLLANCYGQRPAVVAGLGRALKRLHSSKSHKSDPGERLVQIAELAGRLHATELCQSLAFFSQTGELYPDDWDDLLEALRQPRQRNESRVLRLLSPFLFSNAETFLRGRLGGAVIGDDLWIPDRIEKFLGRRLDDRLDEQQILQAIRSEDLAIVLPALRAARHRHRSLAPLLLAILEEAAQPETVAPAGLFHAMLLLGEFADLRAHPFLLALPVHHPEMRAIWGRSQSLRPWCWCMRRCGGDPGRFFRNHANVWPASLDPVDPRETKDPFRDNWPGAAEVALDDFLRSPAGRTMAAEW